MMTSVNEVLPLWILVFPKTQKSQTFELQFISECSSQKKKKKNISECNKYGNVFT